MSEVKNNLANKAQKNTDFLQAKDANEKYYSSLRNTMGVRIIGLIAGLFTLLQTVQDSKTKPLSDIFSMRVPKFDILERFAGLLPWKFLAFFISVCFLLFFIFRTFFRYALFSRYMSKLYWLKEDDITRFPKKYEWLKKEPMRTQVREATGMKIAGKLEGQQKGDRLFFFHYDWFIYNVSWARQFWGNISCLGLSLCSTALILFLLW